VSESIQGGSVPKTVHPRLSNDMSSCIQSGATYSTILTHDEHSTIRP
jgi:hypothetical protein